MLLSKEAISVLLLRPLNIKTGPLLWPTRY